MRERKLYAQINQTNVFFSETRNETTISLRKMKNGTTIFLQETRNEILTISFSKKKNSSNARINYFEFDFPMINKNTNETLNKFTF